VNEPKTGKWPGVTQCPKKLANMQGCVKPGGFYGRILSYIKSSMLSYMPMRFIGVLLVSFSTLAALTWTLVSASATASGSPSRSVPGDLLATQVAGSGHVLERVGQPGESLESSGSSTSAAGSGEDVDSGPTVVIDPGHGGTNTGAAGVEHGFYEKAFTLAMARGVAERLRARNIRVVLTRERDTYLTLRERVRRANQLRADLFVSLHANATPSHQHSGYETFILSPRAVDIDGRALRIVDGAPRAELDHGTAGILDDLERGMAQPRAAALAADIQDGLRAIRGAPGDRGVRQDSMHVLLGATMPAVLVEVGFIDHPVEGGELRDPEIQSDLCDALADAIARSLAQ